MRPIRQTDAQRRDSFTIIHGNHRWQQRVRPASVSQDTPRLGNVLAQDISLTQDIRWQSLAGFDDLGTCLNGGYAARVQRTQPERCFEAVRENSAHAYSMT